MTETEIEAIKRGVSDDELPKAEHDDEDGIEEISPKKMIKILNLSNKFPRRKGNWLTKAI